MKLRYFVATARMSGVMEAVWRIYYVKNLCADGTRTVVPVNGTGIVPEGLWISVMIKRL